MAELSTIGPMPLLLHRTKMRANVFISAIMLFAFSTPSSGSYVVPTTTLAAETSNNTSAAGGFSTQTNGNRAAGNVSKVDVHSLLYTGATTKVYAHLLLWFGQSNHMNIGYSSADPAQIQRQIEDMISRGIDGVIIDWYGPNNAIDQAAHLVMAEAEKHPGFTFAIMIDESAIKWDSCTGCSPQQALIDQVQYIEQEYFRSPAYLTEQRQPVVTSFNLDIAYSIDWNAVNASLSTKPLFWFQNNDGFSRVLSGGSYSWVMPTSTDYGANYLSSFYGTGMSFPNEQTIGAAYKGFNDALASWGSNRIMGQQCGQTWLQTFSEINKLYNSGKQLPDLQLVTWNDYEEGTEIESGIDNCFTVSPSITQNSLQWSVQGNENTVDHYSVYISNDGQSLMPLTDISAGLHSLNLCSFPVPAGNYQLFVQAIGKPSLQNQIAGPVPYIPSCTPTVAPPTFSLTASPSLVTVAAGQAGRLTVTAQPQSGSFNNPISLSCAGLPSTLTCSFSPATVTPGSNSVPSSLTIAPVSVAKITSPSRRQTLPIYAAWFLSFGIAGFTLIGNRRNRRRTRAVVVCAVIGLGTVAISCGGKNVVTTAAPAVYTVTISGNSSAGQFSTTIRVALQ